MWFVNIINKFNRKIFILIVVLFFSVTSSTYAYLFYTGNNNSITGNMGKVDLELTVTRVLPVDQTVNSILIFQFDELADNLNRGCIDSDGDYSLCQLYKINLKNKNGGVNTKVKGSLAFSNDTMPNLSWILLGNTYSSSTNYTSSMLGNKFNTASSTYNSFVDDYLLRNGDEISFYILVWVNEIDRIQYDRGSYGGVVRFEDHNGNGVTAEFGDVSSLIANHIISLYNDNESIDTVHIGGNTEYPQVFLNEKRGILLDNNGHYRYYGMNPNNYVYFNCEDYSSQSSSTCELWRIIGAFTDIDDGTGKLETRVKIIRQASIGDYAYDTSGSDINSGQGTNDWSKSDLMHLLNPGYEKENINNSLYWTKGTGSCYYEKTNSYKDCDFSEIGMSENSKRMIGNAKFYLGTFSTEVASLMNSGNYVEFMEKFYAHQMYDYERSSNVYNCSVDDGACPRAIEWIGKIGLMYPSDYIYATDLKQCTSNGIAFGWSDWNHKNLVNPECYTNDWLHTGSNIEWLISPHNEPRYRPFTLQNGKYIFGAYSYHGYEVRPSLYLNSDVYIMNGEGTQVNPYQLIS